MSTRANVILKKGNRKIYLYRHCDGYPSGLGKELKECINKDPIETIFNIFENTGVELTNGIHGDIEYLYTVDLDDLTINCE